MQIRVVHLSFAMLLSAALARGALADSASPVGATPGAMTVAAMPASAPTGPASGDGLKADQAQAALRQRLASLLGGKAEDYQLREVAGLRLLELYSKISGEIAYVDYEGRRVLVGKLIDIETRHDLTAERRAELNRIPYGLLPKDRAIRISRGDGRREFVVFEDPDCPFCRQLETQLKALDNFTAYVMLFPLGELHPGAEAAARNIWCSPDPTLAWLDYMRNGKPVHAAPADCSTPLAELRQLAADHHVSGTPTIVLSDGSVMEGLPDLEELTRRLDVLAGR